MLENSSEGYGCNQGHVQPNATLPTMKLEKRPFQESWSLPKSLFMEGGECSYTNIKQLKNVSRAVKQTSSTKINRRFSPLTAAKEPQDPCPQCIGSEKDKETGSDDEAGAGSQDMVAVPRKVSPNPIGSQGFAMSHVQSSLLSQPKVVRTSGKTSAQQSLCQWGAGLDSTCETQNRGETEELGACATRKVHRPISNTPGAFFQRAPQRSNDSPPGLCGTLRVAFRCYQNHRLPTTLLSCPSLDHGTHLWARAHQIDPGTKNTRKLSTDPGSWAMLRSKAGALQAAIRCATETDQWS